MKVFYSLIFSFLLFTTSVPKSEAVVGLIIKDKMTKTVGGVVTISGLAGMGVGIIVAQTGSWAGLGYLALGMSAGALGLVILDESEGTIQFSELSKESGKDLGLSNSELTIYNSEVDQLNAIKDTIASQLSDEASSEEVASLWSEYKESVSPETLKVAAHVVLNLK